MLKVSVLNSSSSGNSTILDNGTDRIVIDAGINAKLWKDRAKAQGYEMKQMSAVFITHAHVDHVNTSFSALCKELGSDKVWTTKSVHNDIHRRKISGYDITKVNDLEIGKMVIINSFSVRAVKMIHHGNISECIGFHIHDTVNNKHIIYATDTQTLDYIRVPEEGFDLHMIEANHNLAYVRSLFQMFNVDYIKKKQLERTLEHLSIEKLSAWLLMNNHRATPVIILHESKQNKPADEVWLNEEQYYGTFFQGEKDE